MINKIISAVCTNIYDEFGDDYEIHKESIEQGLEEPCFFVQALAPIYDRQLPTRVKRQVTVMVQYFPLDKVNYYVEGNEVLEKLFRCLEEITVDDCLYRGEDMESAGYTEEGVLSFQITFEFFEYEPNEEELMESHTDNIGIKE